MPTDSADLRAPGTPDSVDVRDTARPPFDDPTLGVALPPLSPAALAHRPSHRLVTIGDSLTHGFQSGAIHNTSLSWPKIVAWELGWDRQMRVPRYDAYGGLPLNVEYVIRDLQARFGSAIGGIEYPLAAFRLRQLMAEVEDYWERGAGAAPPVATGIMHNLGVYGWDLRDALSHTTETLECSIVTPKDDLLTQVVENANERAALRVYPRRSQQERRMTVFDAAAALGTEGQGADPTAPGQGDGIETLVVMLGANNALGTVTSLEVRWSGPGYDDLQGKKAYNVWDPVHFAAELAQVKATVEKIPARYVIFGTVPHVTIAPIARGVAHKIRPGSRYFPYYTRPWVGDGQFNPKDDPHITAAQARAIDSAIDQYNDAIAEMVRNARQDGRRWFLLDLAAVLDRLACRRYIDDPQARPDWWTPYDLPPALRALDPVPDSRFFRAGPAGRSQGGIFSLDGVHPTTIAYGIVAQEVINVMQRAGVVFHYGDGRTERTGPVAVDFERLIESDTLIASPPTNIDANLKLFGWLDETLDWVARIVPGRAGATLPGLQPPDD